VKNELLEEIKVSDVAREIDAAVMSASFKRPARAIRMRRPGGASGPVAVGQDYVSRAARRPDRRPLCGLPTDSPRNGQNSSRQGRRLLAPTAPCVRR
jgi:hypothetical protein